MEVARAADVGVHDHRLFGGRRTGTAVEVVGENRGDALVVERTNLDGTRGDPLGVGRIKAAQQPHDPQAGTETLFGVRPVSEDGDDQPFGAGADALSPALEAFGRPLGIAAMGTGHVLGIRAMEPAAIAAQMRGDTLAAMEDLDGARGDADLDLFADQGVRHRIEEAVDLDVVVRADPSQAPFGIDIRRWQQCL